MSKFFYAKLKNSDKYKSFTKKKHKSKDGVLEVLGTKEDGNVELEGYTFNKDDFTEKQAEDWLSDGSHDFSSFGTESDGCTWKKKDRAGDGERVMRYDRGEIRNAQMTEEGFLTADAIVTRIGVFRYQNPDGSISKELRHPDDVFLQDSLATMKMIPITKLHPPEVYVDSRNSQRLAKGYTGEAVRVDGRFVKIPLKVTDQGTIDAIMAGMQELSLGYAVVKLDEVGEYDNETYEIRQTEIDYNHLAVVPNARAGHEARIVLNAADAIQCDDTVVRMLVEFTENTSGPKEYKFSDPYRGDDHYHSYMVNAHGRGKTSATGADVHEHEVFNFTAGWYQNHYHDLLNIPKLNNDSTKKQKRSDNMEMEKVNVDGLTYEAAPEVVKYLEKETKRADTAETALTEQTDANTALQAKFDEKEAELKTLKEKDTNADIKTAANERLALIRKVEPLLDEETKKKLHEMDEKDIKVAVIKSKYPDIKLDDKDDVYIGARFDAVIEAVDPEQNADEGISSQRQNANSGAPTSEGGVDQSKSREKMVSDITDAWKPKKEEKKAA